MKKPNSRRASPIVIFGGGFLGLVMILALALALLSPSAEHGSNPSEPSQNSPLPPKTFKMQDDFVFRELRDQIDFSTQYSEALKKLEPLLSTPDGGTTYRREADHMWQALKSQFAGSERVWQIPVGTEIKILKFYDWNGNEITPRWNEPQKTYYTPDGHSVYISGEWNGKIIYTVPTTHP